MIDKRTAFAIKIIRGTGWSTEYRYFNSFGKKGRLSSAWHLAGAKLFMDKDDEKMQLIKKKLERKKIKFEVTAIEDLPF
jgi:hypothetical protein